MRISRELWRELYSGRHSFSPAETRALYYAVEESWATYDPARDHLPKGQRGKLSFSCSGAVLAAAIGLSSEEEGRRVLARLVARNIFACLTPQNGKAAREYAINKDYESWLPPPGNCQGLDRATARVSTGQLPGGNGGNCQGETGATARGKQAAIRHHVGPQSLPQSKGSKEIQRSSSIKPCLPRAIPRATLAPAPDTGCPP